MSLDSIHRHHRLALILLATVAGVVWLVATCCQAPYPGTPLTRRGDEISICGQLFHTGTPVVLWTDPGGYDAYRVSPRFDPNAKTGEKMRYGARRELPPDVHERVLNQGWGLEDLQKVVRMLVLHYDVCGTSRQCFKVLHDVRGLSVHFMLDVDGTIYQTLDLKERAWHAGSANNASVGIEIAQIGAYQSPTDTTLQNWYRHDPDGPVVHFPEWMKETGIRTPGFVARPARDEVLSGRIHGRTYHQYDFTDEQYEALAKLCAALNSALPRIRLTAPRDATGAIHPGVLTPDQLAGVEGIVGHWHLTTRKVDPGPALDWDRLLDEARSWQ